MHRPLVVLACLLAALLPATAPADAAPRHRGYTLMFGSKAPARWDPCQVISYRVDEHQMPQGGRQSVAHALHEVAKATGLRFRYEGDSRYVPYARHARAFPGTSDLVIAWSTAAAVPALAGITAGVGGAQAGLLGTSGWRALGQGGVVLDTTAKLGSTHAQVRRNREILLLHELGHVVGLGHTADKHEIMHSGSYGSTTYGPGDLRGLAAVGADNGCL